MIQRHELALYLHNFLACDEFNDYCPNGLQIEGKPQIRRIATAVTASMEAILAAISWEADALLVHHGYFWRGESPVIQGMKRQRIEHLLRHDINLFAYHLPLDCHLELGNNACIAKCLQVQSVKMQKAGNTHNLLWSGRLPTPMSRANFKTLLQNTFQQEPLHIGGHDKEISHIAWCSGAAQDFIEDASLLGADAFISGEVSERTYHQAKELGIDYYCCGHHATERFGVQSLGQYVSNHFNLDCQFLDIHNPY